ncbi:hypothetical protein OCUBac02_18460 [Bosea sp. ANAM02]|nr:hypothetical protein OCUBac02_18460 [Bosea sp. ANAM02]
MRARTKSGNETAKSAPAETKKNPQRKNEIQVTKIKSILKHLGSLLLDMYFTHKIRNTTKAVERLAQAKFRCQIPNTEQRIPGSYDNQKFRALRPYASCAAMIGDATA